MKFSSGAIGCKILLLVGNNSPPNCRSSPSNNKVSITFLVSSEIARIINLPVEDSAVDLAVSFEFPGATPMLLVCCWGSFSGGELLSTSCPSKVCGHGCAAGNRVSDLLVEEVPGGLLLDEWLSILDFLDFIFPSISFIFLSASGGFF